MRVPSTGFHTLARRVSSVVVAAVISFVGLALTGPLAAYAHTDLIGSNPKDGAALKQLPTEVTLTFNEKLQQPGYIVVTSPSGTKIAEGEALISGAVASTEVDPAAVLKAEAGSYKLAFRVVSSDGHPVSKTLSFTLNPPPNPLGDKSQSSGPVDQGAESTEATTPTDSGQSPSSANNDTAASDEVGSESFWEQHDVHIAWGVGLLAIAIGLLWFERRRHTTH